jgi:restriction system protein
MKKFPYTYDDMFNPLLSALRELGGSGSNSEIEDKVAEILKLSDDDINIIHKGNRSKFSYRLAWTRNYLKRYGLLENSSRGVWSLTKQGYETEKVDQTEVNKAVKEIDKREKTSEIVDINEGAETGEEWQDELLETIKKIEPDQFERLGQRLLRELGFANVTVEGRSGDGGIDGRGILKIGGVISFHVVFQSKRYSGSVGSPIVRDFRGAMSGRAEKGLIITTGTFTASAKKEAKRDGATPIDLIDGIELAKTLKELGLGVKIETVEKVVIKKDFYENL